MGEGPPLNSNDEDKAQFLPSFLPLEVQAFFLFGGGVSQGVSCLCLCPRYHKDKVILVLCLRLVVPSDIVVSP